MSRLTDAVTHYLPIAAPPAPKKDALSKIIDTLPGSENIDLQAVRDQLAQTYHNAEEKFGPLLDSAKDHVGSAKDQLSPVISDLSSKVSDFTSGQEDTIKRIAPVVAQAVTSFQEKLTIRRLIKWSFALTALFAAVGVYRKIRQAREEEIILEQPAGGASIAAADEHSSSDAKAPGDEAAASSESPAKNPE